LASHYRNLLICKDQRTLVLLEVVESVQERFSTQAKEIDNHILLRAIAVISKADVEYKQAKNQRLLVEITLMQICSLKKELEKKNP
jgi:DNA polymerase-3 subunit gamma/tau